MTRLVLVGAGHAHAQVLYEFARQPAPGIEIVLVSPDSRAPYSGMVPGWLAGHYTWEECCIDFAHLCRQSGARLRLARASDIDLDRRILLLDDGQAQAYDWLSLDIGSTLRAPGHANALLPMRPLATLRRRWDHLLDELRRLPPGDNYRVVMAGGGAAGVESMLAAARRLPGVAPDARFDFTLATHGEDILPGMAAGATRRLRHRLDRERIRLVTGFSAAGADAGRLRAQDGRTIEADIILWATGAQAWPWPVRAGLAVDAHGFVRVDACLRSLSHPTVFAAGDCAGWALPLPKAGVYAVRMGPVLAYNLRAAASGGALQAYRPQARTLALVGTGGEHAVATWGPLAWEGAWVWRWKQRIDRNFVARYNRS